MHKLPEPGGRLGRFRIERRLGSGGMGVVFLATDTMLDVRVALKVLMPWLNRKELFDRFKREVLLARRVSHPGICRLFDIHEEGEIKFITMEYIEGSTLEEIIREKGVIPASTAGGIMVAVCQALAAAHKQGITHRDLKPSNIMVLDRGRISILDFGLAKPQDMDTITATGFSVGTIHYMSPEVTAGKVATPKSDIYSLGVILYRCVTGRMPFGGKGILDVKKAIETGKAMPPRMYNPDVTAALEKITLKAISHDPRDRYGSVEEFKLALREEGTEISFHEDEFSSSPWHGDIERSVQEVVVDPDFERTQKRRVKDTTIMFSDIVGITPYFDKYGDMMGSRKIQIHNELLFPVIEQYKGRVVKTIGDAIMACFDKPDNGVEAAVEMQKTLNDYNAGMQSTDDQILIRIGLHSGKPIFESKDVFGNTVNVAARISSKANGSEILISSATREMLSWSRNKTEFHSVTKLKGKQDIYNLYSVKWRSEVSDSAISSFSDPMEAEQTEVGEHKALWDDEKEEPTDVSVEEEITEAGQATTPLQEEGTIRQQPPFLSALTSSQIVEQPTFVDERTSPTISAPKPKQKQKHKKRSYRNAIIIVGACVLAMAAGSLAYIVFMPGSDAEKSGNKIKDDSYSVVVEDKVAQNSEDVGVKSGESGIDESAGADNSPEPELVPAIPLQKESESPLVELSKLERSIYEKMRRKGVIAGDNRRLDNSCRRMTELRDRLKYLEAKDHAIKAVKILDGIHISKSFVTRKLNRFNRLFESVTDPAASEKIGEIAIDAMAAFESGKFYKANMILNKAFHIIEKGRR